jgi:hypothetical protein
MREKDQIHAVWRTIGVLLEALTKTDSAVKYVLREMSAVIKHAGIEPAMGNPEDIKNIVLTEQLKSLKHIPDTPKAYYTYNNLVAMIGTVLVVLGTIIWGFGDKLINYYIA